VRGLLCKGCNSKVDLCPHTAGCRYAAYLADPPAYRLALRYPKMDRTLRDQRRRMADWGSARTMSCGPGAGRAAPTPSWPASGRSTAPSSRSPPGPLRPES
jgi:hypothetical protein